jgi:hypothetical protein
MQQNHPIPLFNIILNPPQIYDLVYSTDLFSPFMSGPVLHDMMYYCGEIPGRWREYLAQSLSRKKKVCTSRYFLAMQSTLS